MGFIMIDTPQIVQTDDQPAAVIHLIVSCGEIVEAMDDSAIAEVLSILAAQGIAPAGRAFPFTGEARPIRSISRWGFRLACAD
jgi:hypothetical protein